MSKYRIALAGNPNSGKTCIFNALTGARQHVGNYPGVTVEHKTGNFSLDGHDIELVDLPGVYSISSNSPEEKVVFQELTTTKLDLIINVIDSSIPERSMYLTTQLMELKIPMLLVLNMSDEAKKRHILYDHKKVEDLLGLHVVHTVGRSTAGVKSLVEALSVFLHYGMHHYPSMLQYGNGLDQAIETLTDAITQRQIPLLVSPRFFATKLLENDATVYEMPQFKEFLPLTNQLLKKLNAHDDTIMAHSRYAMLEKLCSETISNGEKQRRDLSRKIDKVLTNKYLGLPIFLLIIFLTFFFTFFCAQPFMDMIEGGFEMLGDAVKQHWSEQHMPFLRSLFTDGILAGVGGVLVFLPNILFLFLAIAILEDTGYMSRAAFVMDGVMRKFGLHGRAFVPLILGFGCNVPAIMATRTIESERDRKVTIMVLPLMSCGARLPIYSLIIPAFFAPGKQAAVLWCIYIIGVVVALIAAGVMKRTLFKGEGEVFMMELPTYRMPSFKSLVLHTWDHGKMYLHKASTIILMTSILLYLCNSYPKIRNFSKDYDAEIQELQQSKGEQQEIQAKIQELENQRAAEEMEHTISGSIGKFLEPAFKPLGFDWKIVTASMAGLAAKEIFVSQLGILYAQGESDEASEGLRQQLRNNYSALQGFCIMLFTLLSIPCMATLAIIKKELNSWKWSAIAASWLFVLAYICTLFVFQIGTRL